MLNNVNCYERSVSLHQMSIVILNCAACSVLQHCHTVRHSKLCVHVVGWMTPGDLLVSPI